ncbi:MAG TPA: nucleotidyltransferase domain-containing protein [Nitriliruptorales bacterium]
MSTPSAGQRVDLDEVVATLRAAGARFAYVHGSVVSGTAGPDSDVDVAAWFDGRAPDPWTVDLPGRVDLLVLDGAPLELAGRVAMHGELLFDDDPAARVRWQATTRKIYLDEQHRVERATHDLIDATRPQRPADG